MPYLSTRLEFLKISVLSQQDFYQIHVFLQPLQAFSASYRDASLSASLISVSS